MNATDFIICCRRLVGALRQPPRADDGHATFFLGFDPDGVPFYKAGSFNAGQLTSAFTEPLFFSLLRAPRARRADAAAPRGRAARRAAGPEEDGDEELTRLALEETREVETAFAPRRALRRARARGASRASRGGSLHGLGVAGSGRRFGTGALNATFS